MSRGDPRETLARPDLADAALEGLVRAERFAPTVLHYCAAPSAALRREPAQASEQMDQLIFGEAFAVLESAQGWAWGQAARDGYVGFVQVHDLAAGAPAATHRVRALRTFGFSQPSIKSAPTGLYSLNALLAVDVEEGRFFHTAGAGWFVREQLCPMGLFESDPAAVAERFVGTPYLWGGRESLGLDCSGLVQQALYACGLGCPRDTDQQALLGSAAPDDALERGDLVFWRGHVGLMLDDVRLIHANAHHMAVATEPLAEAVARIGPPTAYRRLSSR